MSSAKTPTKPMYAIKHAAGKGHGVFAERAIPKGTRITVERPLLTAPREPGTIDPLTVYEAFDTLSPKDQETYLSLSASEVQIGHALACMDEDLDEDIRNQVARIGSIFESNAFNIGDEDENGIVQAGIFPIAARFNHDCKPNVAQTWNENLRCLTIRAIRHIEEGEEMCDSYVPLCQPSAVRKDELRAYGFECRCSVCGGLSPEHLRKSDEQRVMIHRLGEDLNFYARRRRGSWVGPISPSLVKGGQDDPLNVLRYLEHLLQEEGLTGHDLVQYYSFASWYCSMQKPENHKESLEWQQKLFDLNVTLKGHDHEDTVRSKERLDKLRRIR